MERSPLCKEWHIFTAEQPTPAFGGKVTAIMMRIVSAGKHLAMTR